MPHRRHDALKVIERALPKVTSERRIELLLLRTESIEDAWQVADFGSVSV